MKSKKSSRRKKSKKTKKHILYILLFKELDKSLTRSLQSTPFQNPGKSLERDKAVAAEARQHFSFPT